MDMNALFRHKEYICSWQQEEFLFRNRLWYCKKVTLGLVGRATEICEYMDFESECVIQHFYCCLTLFTLQSRQIKYELI